MQAKGTSRKAKAMKGLAQGPGREEAVDEGSEEGGKDKAAPGPAAGGQDLRLLYVTPERVVASKRLMGKLEKLYKVSQSGESAVTPAHPSSH